MKIKMKIPKRFYRVDSVRNTIAMRNPSTGRFTGRRKTYSNPDRTRVLRIVRDIDINGDGKKDPVGGYIMGRTSTVKATPRARGYIRGL